MTEDEDRAEGSVAPPGAEPPAIRGGEGLGNPPTPLDADDTRGRHLSGLLRNPWALSLGATALIAAFVIGTSQGNVAIGGGGAAVIVLLILLVAFVIASGRAKEDFFEAYASGRGLNRKPKGSLPPATPLLRKGDRRKAEQIMNGTLPGGLPGAIALYTYEEDSTDSDGDRETSSYHFTVVMHDLPTVAPIVADIHCQRRSGFRWMDSAEDVFRRMKRLELESDALDKRYEIFYGTHDDENLMKQVFSPSFIVWLTDGPPGKFAWEFSGGSLCVNVSGHYDSAGEFDGLCEAASVVAKRLAAEAAE